MKSYKKGDTEFLLSGPVPDFWRAPTDNDFGNGLDRRSRVWRKAGETRKLTSVTVSKPTPKSAKVTMFFNLVNESGRTYRHLRINLHGIRIG